MQKCGHENTTRDTQEGEIRCSDCGLILDNDLVKRDSSDKRSFSQEEKERNEHHGKNLTFSKRHMGMQTSIGKGTIEIAQSKDPAQYTRLRKWQNRSESSIDRRMEFCIRESQMRLQSLNLPHKYKEDVCQLWRRCLKNGLIKGREKERMLSAIIYIVSRRFDTPVTLSELSEEFDLDRRNVGKDYKYITRELDINQRPVDPRNLLERYSNQLDLFPEDRKACKDVLEDLREKGVMSGRKPTAILSAVIYYTVSIARHRELSQAEIARTLGVTEVTVRKNYQHIQEFYEIEEGEIPV